MCFKCGKIEHKADLCREQPANGTSIPTTDNNILNIAGASNGRSSTSVHTPVVFRYKGNDQEAGQKEKTKINQEGNFGPWMLVKPRYKKNQKFGIW